MIRILNSTEITTEKELNTGCVFVCTKFGNKSKPSEPCMIRIDNIRWMASVTTGDRSMTSSWRNGSYLRRFKSLRGFFLTDV